MNPFDEPLEVQIASEIAASLGKAGRQLRTALDNLSSYDSDVTSGKCKLDTIKRNKLVEEAAERFWSYVVQREIIGLSDAEYIGNAYGVPQEVWEKMGPKTTPRTKE